MAVAPERLAEWVRPEHTALVMNECQRGVVGAESSLPDLAAAAQLGIQWLRMKRRHCAL